MCRGLGDKNPRRCPGCSGEARNAKDRVRYTLKEGRAQSSPVDETITHVEMPPELIEADLAITALDLTQKLYDVDPNSVFFADVEKEIRDFGLKIEAEAEEIAGVTHEEIYEESQARIAEAERLRKIWKQRSEIRSQSDLSKDQKRQMFRKADFDEANMSEEEREEFEELAMEIELADELYKEIDEKFTSESNKVFEAYGLPQAENSFDALSIGKLLINGADEGTKSKLKALVDARLEVLGRIRDFGGEIESDGKSSKRVQKVMAEVADIYPSDWIQNSNSAGNLRVKDTKGRAHYSHFRSQKQRKPILQQGWADQGEMPPGGGDWERGVFDIDTHGWVPAQHADQVKNAAEPGSAVEYGQVLWTRPAYKVRRSYSGSVEGKPPRGWEEAFEETSSGEKVRVFRQPMHRMVHAETTAELTVDKDRSADALKGVPGYGTAVHEFAHRCEYTTPVIPKLENAFLVRRTTNEDGEREALQPIYGSTREMSRRDSFVDKYMGKEYGKDSTGTSAKEVMSTGMEAVFDGAFGAFNGVNGKTDDKDHRAFVLGVLATA